MSKAGSSAEEVSTTRPASGGVAALGVPDWVNLAAAPVFALMALAAGMLGGDHPEMHCTAGHYASPLSGMALMYLLMSVFHSAPWLRLISGRRARWR